MLFMKASQHCGCWAVLALAYARSPLSRWNTGSNCSIWRTAVCALIEDLEKAVSPVPRSPKLVKRKAVRSSPGAVRKVPSTGAAPSWLTSYT